VDEINALEVFRPQGRTGAEGDTTVPTTLPQRLPEFEVEGGGDFLGENNDPQPAGTNAAEKALDLALRGDELPDDCGGTVGPAEDEDVVVEGDRGEAALEAAHRPLQPLGHDRDQGAHEEYVPQDRHHRGNEAEHEPPIVAEVSRVGEAQEGPPDRTPKGRKGAGHEKDEPPCGEGDEGDEHREKNELVVSAPKEELFQGELRPLVEPPHDNRSTFMSWIVSPRRGRWEAVGRWEVEGWGRGRWRVAPA
jgi:hypothetical protein